MDTGAHRYREQRLLSTNTCTHGVLDAHPTSIAQAKLMLLRYTDSQKASGPTSYVAKLEVVDRFAF